MPETEVLSEKLPDNDIQLLKGYFGKSFYKDIEKYCDPSYRILNTC